METNDMLNDIDPLDRATSDEPHISENDPTPEQTDSELSKLSSPNWPVPLPLTSKAQSAPYPSHALPGIIGDAVREVVGYVQCPMALGACSALAAISIIGQGLVDVRRSDGLEGPTSLYFLPIANSGERKTMCDNCYKKRIQLWDAKQKNEAKPAIVQFAAELDAWKAKKSGYLAAIKSNTKSGRPTEALEQRVADLEAEKPMPPIIPCLLFGDSTPEAMALRLAHVWPVAGVHTCEAGTVLGGTAMKNDSAMRNMSMLSSLWGAEELRIDRKSSPSFTVRAARLTMSLSVQPQTLRAFLESSKGLARGSGWLARFLIAWPDSTQGHRTYKEPPDNWPCMAKFHKRVAELLDTPLNFNDRGELEPTMLELSPEAKEAWVAFHDSLETELLPGRDMSDTKDFASKAAENAARMAALFHLFEKGQTGSIGLDHMKASTRIVKWHLNEARRFLQEIEVSAGISNAEKLEKWLIAYCDEADVSQVATSHILQRGPACARKKASLEFALNELVESNRVRLETVEKRNIVEINPALLKR